MTSRTLSLNLFKGECRRKLWLYALSFMILVAYLPGRLLMNIDRWAMWGWTKSQMIPMVKDSVSISYTGLLFLIVGIFYGAICFGYVFSRSKVDLYHSIPIDRKRMFTVRFLTGMIPYILIRVVVSVLELLVVLVKGMSGNGIGAVIGCEFVYSIFLFIVGFSITVIGYMLSGNMLIGQLIGLAIIVGGEFIQTVIGWYRSYCFQTYSYLSSESYSWWKAILFPSNIHENLGALISLYPGRFLILIASAVIYTLIAAWLFVIRPSESAGRALSFSALQPVIRIPMVIMAALAGGIYLVFVSGDFMTAGWYWLIFAGTGVVTHIIAEIVLQLDFKKCLKHWVQLIFSLAVAAVIACIFLYDLTGYDRYVPKESKVASSSLYLNDIESDMSSFKIIGKGKEAEIEYENRDEHVLEHMQAVDNAAIRQMCDLGAASIDPERSVFKRAEKQRELNNMPYEEWAAKFGIDEEQKTYYTVRYNLKGGRTVYRSYNAKLAEAYGPMEALFDSREYKEAGYQIKEFIDSDIIKKLEFTDNMYNTAFKLEDPDDIRSFLEAMDKDIMDMSFRRIEAEYPVYQVVSSVKMEDSYMDPMYGYYIYPDYQNTLNFLRSKGMEENSDAAKLDVRRIDHIEITDYSYMNSTSDMTLEYTKEVEVPDQTQVIYNSGEDDAIIAEIADLAVLDHFAYVNSVLKPYEEGLDINIYYQTDKGYTNSYYVKIPKGKMPEKIKADLEKAQAEAGIFVEAE